MPDAPDPYELDLISDENVGEGGFLHLRRLRLMNVHPDGTTSRPWVCDFVERRHGVDAVVLLLWREREGKVEVLLRDGLRPALAIGRDPGRVPLPDPRRYFLFTEVVAGIIEEGEVGERAVRMRAVDEAWEEAGARVEPESIVMLGSSFPSPGMSAEKFWFTAARVEGELSPPEGDGSPMEEGARTRWVLLDDALAQCRSGVIEDAKTELCLRRFAERPR